MPDSAAAVVKPVFIDANVLVYFLDETAEFHQAVVDGLQRLVDGNVDLYTTHHVLEEVLFIVSRLSADTSAVSMAIKQIAAIPNLQLAEPAADFAFAERYTTLYRSSKVGINDCLLLQLMLDAGLTMQYSYDAKFIKQAALLNIQEYPL